MTDCAQLNLPVTAATTRGVNQTVDSARDSWIALGPPPFTDEIDKRCVGWGKGAERAPQRRERFDAARLVGAGLRALVPLAVDDLVRVVDPCRDLAVGERQRVLRAGAGVRHQLGEHRALHEPAVQVGELADDRAGPEAPVVDVAAERTRRDAADAARFSGCSGHPGRMRMLHALSQAELLEQLKLTSLWEEVEVSNHIKAMDLKLY